MMQIVSNTTPISELYKINHLDLLRSLYGSIYIPDAVFQELQQAKTVPHLGAAIAQTEWIKVHSIHSPDKRQALQRRYPYLHRGEAAAIVLAQELTAQRIILDDKRARQVAQAEGLPLIGTVGVILLAYRLGQRSRSEAEELLDRLYQGTAYISVTLYQAALETLRQAPS
jgi:predicted nucleic acid-binding protein